MISSSTVNKICLVPIAQQIVGVGTVLSNLVKCINDIGLFIIGGVKHEFGMALAVLDKEKEDELVRKHDKLQYKTRKHLTQHITYIGIGILRAIPIVGSVYSYRQMKADEARWLRLI